MCAEGVPLASRNLPASFFNAAAAAGLASCAVDLYDYDPWHQHYPGWVQHPACLLGQQKALEDDTELTHAGTDTRIGTPRSTTTWQRRHTTIWRRRATADCYCRAACRNTSRSNGASTHSWTRRTRTMRRMRLTQPPVHLTPTHQYPVSALYINSVHPILE